MVARLGPELESHAAKDKTDQHNENWQIECGQNHTVRTWECNK